MTERLPWHDQTWRGVSDRLRAATLPHALLLTGPAGLGKRSFAQYLAQAALCEQGAATGEPCGRCRACILYAAHNHPDLRVAAPLEPGKAISVDQIREAGAFLTQTAHYGGYKVLIIDHADQMNVNAANGLLKTLEEPPARSLILLVSARPGRLPATVVSRCQRLKFTMPTHQRARQWLTGRLDPAQDPDLLLALADGAPLRAAALPEEGSLATRLEVLQGLEALSRGDEDVCAVAERLTRQGLRPALHWMYSGIADMIRLHAGGAEADAVNRDLAPRLSSLTHNASPPGLHRFLQELHRALSLAERPLNPQLLMEELLMSWQALFSPAA
jgi:DNA polymerase-3 subunit delta'